MIKNSLAIREEEIELVSGQENRVSNNAIKFSSQ
jgi:hypothetical protein